jgi:hypothetical protein
MEQNFMHLLNCGTSPTVIAHKKLFNKIAVSLEYFNICQILSACGQHENQPTLKNE